MKTWIHIEYYLVINSKNIKGNRKEKRPLYFTRKYTP